MVVGGSCLVSDTFEPKPARLMHATAPKNTHLVNKQSKSTQKSTNFPVLQMFRLIFSIFYKCCCNVSPSRKYKGFNYGGTLQLRILSAKNATFTMSVTKQPPVSQWKYVKTTIVILFQLPRCLKLHWIYGRTKYSTRYVIWTTIRHYEYGD